MQDVRRVEGIFQGLGNNLLGVATEFIQVNVFALETNGNGRRRGGLDGVAEKGQESSRELHDGKVEGGGRGRNYVIARSKLDRKEICEQTNKCNLTCLSIGLQILWALILSLSFPFDLYCLCVEINSNLPFQLITDCGRPLFPFSSRKSPMVGTNPVV